MFQLEKSRCWSQWDLMWSVEISDIFARPQIRGNTLVFRVRRVSRLSYMISYGFRAAFFQTPVWLIYSWITFHLYPNFALSHWWYMYSSLNPCFRLSLWALLVKLLSQNTFNKSTLVQVMAWCHQATSHHLNQCWPRYMSSYNITKSQCVK